MGLGTPTASPPPRGFRHQQRESGGNLALSNTLNQKCLRDFFQGRKVAAPGLPHSYLWYQKHAHELVLSYSITPAEEEHMLLLLLLLKNARNAPIQAF